MAPGDALPHTAGSSWSSVGGITTRSGAGLGKGAKRRCCRLIGGMRQELDNHATAPDLELARLAANQHGVVSVKQLRAIGIGSDAISRRVRSGRLHRVHRGVYAVGHPRLSDQGRCMAAVLACGAGAVLSHRSAAALWDMLYTLRGATDVTVPRSGGPTARKGIHLHRSTSLHPAHTTLRMGIAVTTPARTLSDLRRCVTVEELGKARRQAEIRGYRLGDQILVEPDFTRSELERRFLRLCRRHRLPSPR